MTCYNVYVDTRTGEHKTMFPRSRKVAVWERDAVRTGFWKFIPDHAFYKPAYMIVVRMK